jgi:hypothetical protein
MTDYRLCALWPQQWKWLRERGRSRAAEAQSPAVVGHCMKSAGQATLAPVIRKNAAGGWPHSPGPRYQKEDMVRCMPLLCCETEDGVGALCTSGRAVWTRNKLLVVPTQYYWSDVVLLMASRYRVMLCECGAVQQAIAKGRSSR